MFRFINAWLQAMFRYITAWLQSAAADDPDAASASLQGTAAMDFPVTVSLGPLHRQLHSSFKAGKNKLPDGVSEGEIQRLQEDLEILFTELKIVSEADDPSFTAKCWMKEVRELRYDTEDFFDEVLRPCAGDGDGTHRSALLTIIFWIPNKLKRRRQVAKAFSDLWARVKDASQRRQSFQLGPATIRPEFAQGNVSCCSRRKLSTQLLEDSMEKLVKLLDLPDEEIVELVAFDTQDAEEQVQVVPIFGFAGVGKTTLARAFYRNFGGKFQRRAFVRVSRNPDMRMLLSSMLSQIKAPPVHGFSDVQDLLDKVREYLQRKRYLIVIDDLWASSTWDIIRCAFPDGDCCSRIIVTTEIEDVALACCRYQFKYMYEMGPLTDEQSRKLFLGRAFGSENDCAPDFKEVTDEIIRKCGGLPLATENIASMLACELNVEQWKHIRDSLPSILSLRTNPRPEGLKEILNIIYNNLSPKLKTCLLYLIMYPEGYTITKDELVKQWVVEDLIGEEQDREKTAEGYFDELVSRGMIQPVDRNYNDEVLTCTVHHMVLDLIRYKSLEENFIITVSCSQTTPGLPDKVRRLSVQFSGAKCANIPADFMITQARSLIFFGFLNCVPSILECKLLRVLTLQIWADQSKIFDLTRITELFQLRYLRINCNITVHLPDEIRQLKFLGTLEIHAPVNDMPSDISCLPLLRTLGYFNLSKNSIENVQNLGELSNLQDLHLTWSNSAEPDNLKNNMLCLVSILWKLSNLKSLTLISADDLDDAGAASMCISGDVLSSVSSPPPLLERLELSGRCCMFSSLPQWTKELRKLCTLKIAVRKLLRKDIDILKGLPALTALSLYVWTAPVGKVVFDNERFSVLKYFKFICAAPCVVFLKGAMPSVRELKLAFSANRMEQYGQVVAGLEYLVELKEITAKVWGTGADESYKRYTELALSGAIANHPCTPVIRVQCIDRIFYGEEDSAITQEQEHWTLQEQHEIQEELPDPLPELLISTPSTQTQTRDGGQNEGTDRSIEVLTQEQEHWTPEKRGIQEELLDPLPECLSTPSTPTQIRDGVQCEEIEGSRDVLTDEQEHSTLEKQHENQEELLDPLSEVLFTPRSREVLTEEQEHWTPVKRHKIQEELLDPLPSQTQTRDGVHGEPIESSMDVLTDEHEHLTLEKQHEIQEELLDPLPEVLSTPSTQTQPRDEVPDGEIERSMKALTQEQEQFTLKEQHEMTVEVQDLQIGRSMEVVAHEEHSTMPKQHKIEKELLDPLPELISIQSTQTQAVNTMQNRGIERSMAVVSAFHGTLGPLLEKLNALLSEEYGDLKGVRREVHFLRSELTDMHAVMRNMPLEGPDVQLKLWISLLREFSYDAEDCIDKFIYWLDNDGRHGGFKEFFRKTASLFGTLGSWHGIPGKIVELNVILKEMKDRMIRYKLVNRSIGSELYGKRNLEDMMRIIFLSYDDLPDNLKTCFLYLSIFPAGCVIERERLVRRWIAEGFIPEVLGQNQQDVAENYFYELINKSMIQAVDIGYDGRARACLVHPMMLELIISKSAEYNFVTVIGSGQTGLVSRDGRIRRLSVQHIDQNPASVLANEDLSHVRSLTVASSSCIEHFCSLAQFENLRVLDFEGCDGLETYHMKGTDKLFQLKYLSLKGTWISHLPSDVVMLHSLETLDIRETHVQELPAGIDQLTKLQHLIASTDDGSAGIKIPNRIRNMKNLRVLLGCDISLGSTDALEELGNLTNLNELDVLYWGIGSEYKRHEEMLLFSLCKLGGCKLQSFRIKKWCPGLLEFLELWSPPPFSLQRFETSGCCNFRCIPRWITPELTNLAYLEINIVEVTEKDLLMLGEIPALRHLGLKCQSVRKERLTFQGRGFRCLKELVYDAAVLPSANLLFEGGALPMLEDLVLTYCISTVNAYGFNLGIHHLRRLKNVQVCLYKEGVTSSDITSAVFAIKNEANAHPNRPRVTLTEHAWRMDYCRKECRVHYCSEECRN